MLQWLHEHGCPWDEDICQVAAERGQVDILKYAIRHDCPQPNDSQYLSRKSRLWDLELRDLLMCEHDPPYYFYEPSVYKKPRL
jgi:hypothetical protein